MRFLGIGEDGDLGAMYWGLAQAGHEVRMYVGNQDFADVYAGMVEHTCDWRADVDWIRAAGDEGIIVFESATRGALQDRLRGEGLRVIGGSAYGDRLESDRSFGQAQLAGNGLRTAACHRFTDFEQAIAFVRDTRRRYVYKSNGASSPRTRNYVGMRDDGADMASLLDAYRAQWNPDHAPDFVLMEHVDGIEVGIGAYFNGERFVEPVCLDWEHKRFFPGDLGELTGEMGTIVSYRGGERIFEATLTKIADSLRESGYCGYINLNLMANADGLWPLEFTSRFGYPGYAICESLHDEGWDSIFTKLLERRDEPIATRDGFACGVVLTVPPFPYRYGYRELSKGLPVMLDPGMSARERAALHLAEVARVEGCLVTSGAIGYVGVATGAGASVQDACVEAYALARKVIVPNVRYRTDIGARVAHGDLDALRTLGYLQ